MSKTPKPVESFGPELFQALIEGSKRTIEIPLPYNKAVPYRLRLNQLRNSMRELGHPMYKVVSMTTISIKWGEDAGFPPEAEQKSLRHVKFPKNRSAPAKLVISPADTDFGDALRAAGVTVPGPSSAEPQSGRPVPTTADLDFLEEFVRDDK